MLSLQWLYHYFILFFIKYCNKMYGVYFWNAQLKADINGVDRSFSVNFHWIRIIISHQTFLWCHTWRTETGISVVCGDECPILFIPPCRIQICIHVLSCVKSNMNEISICIIQDWHSGFALANKRRNIYPS